MALHRSTCGTCGIRSVLIGSGAIGLIYKQLLYFIMNASDQHKLVDAGFTIIRREDHLYGHLRIKFKGTWGNVTRYEWSTLEKDFETKAALERRMKELLKDPMIVED